jgi:hypothetical protein
MSADVSRVTFRPENHFARVVLGQGCALIDADWNEQAAILLYRLQTLAGDVFGPHWGPADPAAPVGFSIDWTDSSKTALEIGKGRYYVQGVLCENDDDNLHHNGQPDYPLDDSESEAHLQQSTDFLVYLDVWERHLSRAELFTARDPALVALDATTRSRIVWQVRVATPSGDDWKALAAAKPIDPGFYTKFLKVLPPPQPPNLPAVFLTARASDSGADRPGGSDDCVIGLQTAYRGVENQLYRVQVHRGGKASSLDSTTGIVTMSQPAGSAATFKWSRDNGSTVLQLDDYTVNDDKTLTATVTDVACLTRSRLAVGDWVELLDDFAINRNAHSPLLKVTSINKDSPNPGKAVIVLDLGKEHARPFDKSKQYHTFLRLWNQRPRTLQSNAVVRPGELVSPDDDPGALILTGNNVWLDLESGVQIQFSGNGDYQSGDYWLIPARQGIGDVLWPLENLTGPPKPLPPERVKHYYAPLAINSGKPDKPVDCRLVLDPSKVLNTPKAPESPRT